jgi:hypothetical protein
MGLSVLISETWSYARNAAGDATGVDPAHGGGFVNTPSSQYEWGSASGGYVFLQNQNPTSLTLTLKSVGDFPLVVEKIEPSAALAKASVKSSTCLGAPVKSGGSCAIVITYDPRGLPPGDDPYTAYDKLTAAIVSNSGQAPDFSETIEVPVAPGG